MSQGETKMSKTALRLALVAVAVAAFLTVPLLAANGDSSLAAAPGASCSVALGASLAWLPDAAPTASPAAGVCHCPGTYPQCDLQMIGTACVDIHGVPGTCQNDSQFKCGVLGGPTFFHCGCF